MIRDLLDNGDILEIISTLIAFALIIAAILSLFFIIFGGITFILSAGKEEKIKQAVHTIRYAIVGLIVCFVAFFAVQWISTLLGIPFELTFSTIIDLMNEIFTSLGSGN